MGTQSAAIFSLAPTGAQQPPGAGMSQNRNWGKKAPSRPPKTHQLCRTHSKPPHARNTPLLSCSSSWHFGRLHFSPWVSFAHTALCGGEVQTHSAGTCPWIDPFPPSIMNYLSNSIFFIHTCVRYHCIPSSSSVHYRTPAFFSCRRFSFP